MNCIEEEGAAGGVEGPQNVIVFVGRSTYRQRAVSRNVVASRLALAIRPLHTRSPLLVLPGTVISAKQYDAPMRRTAIVGGRVAAVGGVVWMLQGLNSRFAPRSFMTGNREWVLYGALTLVAGLALAAWGTRRK